MPRLPRWLAAVALAVLCLVANVTVGALVDAGDIVSATLLTLAAALGGLDLVDRILGRDEDDDHRPPGPPAFGT